MKSERTSSRVATVAGQLLQGNRAEESIAWLEGIVDNPNTTPEDREHAATTIGILSQIKRVAASALTQR